VEHCKKRHKTTLTIFPAFCLPVLNVSLEASNSRRLGKRHRWKPNLITGNRHPKVSLEVHDSRTAIIRWNCNRRAGFPRREMLVAPRGSENSAGHPLPHGSAGALFRAHSIASFVWIAFLPATSHYAGQTGICLCSCTKLLVSRSDTCQRQGKAGRIHSVFPITSYLGNWSRRFYTISWENNLNTT
jgi:hypothetical protein